MPQPLATLFRVILLLSSCLLLASPTWAFSERLATLDKAIATSEIVSNRAQLHLFRSREYQKWGNQKEAIADLDMALLLDPTSEYHYEKAKYHRQLKQNEAALKCLENSLQLNKHYLPAYELRSQIYFANKEYSMAMMDASTILLHDPGNKQASNLVDHCWIGASPRERILIRSNPDLVNRSLARIKNNKSKRRLAARAKPRPAKKKSVKKKNCGPTRRRS